MPNYSDELRARNEALINSLGGLGDSPMPRRQRPAPMSVEDIMKALNPQPEEPQESVVQKYGPTAVRGLAGLFGLTPVTGAIAGGAGEIGAEALEGRFSPAEIAAAAGTGAVGGGMIKDLALAKSALGAAGRGALYGAAMPVVHSVLANGQLPDVSDVAKSAATSGVTAGAIGKLMEMFGIHNYGAKPEAPHQTFQIENLAAPQGGFSRRGPGGKMIADAAPQNITVPVREPAYRAPLVPEGPETPSVTPDDMSEGIANLQQYQSNLKANGLLDPSHIDPYALGSNRVERVMRREAAEAEKQRRLDEVAQREADARDEIDQAKAAGLVPKDLISQSFDAPIAGGRERLRRIFVEPEEEGGEGGGGEINSGLSRDVGPISSDPIAAIQQELARRGQAPGGVEVAPDVGPKLNALKALLEGQVAEKAPLAMKVGTMEGHGALEGELNNALTDLLHGEQPPTAEVEPVREITDTLPDSSKGAALAATNDSVSQLEDLLSRTNGAGAKTVPGNGLMPAEPEPVAEAPVAEAQPEAETPNGVLARFFKSRPDAMGEHYRALKDIQGDLPTEPISGKNPARIAGIGLRREAAEAGLPTKGPVPESIIPPKPVDVSEALKKIDAMKGRPGGALYNLLSTERGELDPRILASLGLAGAGALAGSALDPFHNHVLSGLAGAAAGGSLPMIGAKISELAPRVQDVLATAPADDTRAFVERIKTPQGIADELKRGWDTLPSAVRANLLTNPNLLNNAITAPWGAGVLHGLEQILEGDQRGFATLKAMNPIDWIRDFTNGLNYHEAEHLIGNAERAEGDLVGQAQGPVGKLLAAPGTLITTGDVTTRRRLMELAGHTEDEARRVTSTSDPEFKLFQNIVNFQRGSTAAKFFLPFARTMANITEQSAMRTPGLGFLVQAARENPDPIARQVAQQAVASALIGGEIYAGEHDPTDASVPLWQKIYAGAARNVGGQYSALGSLGFALGKALSKGKTPAQATVIGAKEGLRQMPLPTLDIPNSVLDFLGNEDPSKWSVPKSVIPGSGLMGLLSPKAGKQPHEPRKPRGAKL